MDAKLNSKIKEAKAKEVKLKEGAQYSDDNGKEESPKIKLRSKIK